MNLLDLAALALLAAAMALGASAGFLPQLLGLAGAVAGFGIALLGASALKPALATIDQPLRAITALAGLGLLTLLGEAAGTALGARARAAMRARVVGALDLAGGALVGLAQGALVLWIAGGLVIAGALPGLQRAAAESFVMRSLDALLPDPVVVAADIVTLLEPTDLPDLFAGIEPPPAPPLEPPSSSTARSLAASAEDSTVRVSAIGCGGEQLGSGFFIGDHAVVTNAHVVAGTHEFRIDLGGRSYGAALVLFDSDQDVAVLHVADASAPAIRLAETTPQRGTNAVALGYPGGGPLALAPAVVTASFNADGPDIYRSGSTNREIVELRAAVRRGDSGGPLIVAPGLAGGIVFGASRTNDQVGYAIAAGSVAAEIHRAATRTASVGSGSCLR